MLCGVSRITPQTIDEWTLVRDRTVIALIDRTVEEFAETYGWVWDEVDEAGLGPTFYLPLAWGGASRYLLWLTAHTPDDGIIVEAAADEDPAAARADLLSGLGLDTEAFLVIAEGGRWFARWDPPHNAGSRPATAAPRKRPG